MVVFIPRALQVKTPIFRLHTRLKVCVRARRGPLPRFVGCIYYEFAVHFVYAPRHTVPIKLHFDTDLEVIIAEHQLNAFRSLRAIAAPACHGWCAEACTCLYNWYSFLTFTAPPLMPSAARPHGARSHPRLGGRARRSEVRPSTACATRALSLEYPSNTRVAETVLSDSKGKKNTFSDASYLIIMSCW